MDENKTIAIIGLGYVGLPLAIEFGKKINVIGFDTNKKRIDELITGIDKTNECTKKEIEKAVKLQFTCEIDKIKNAQIYIITVPTPVDKANRPDLTHLMNASKTVAKVLKNNDIVIYESTVYPGATEEICVPILSKISKLKYNAEFYCGYSPERINPGDKIHTLTKIRKITSGSTPQIAEEINNLYKKIILAGTYKAKSIKVAEAAKVIENTQRDLNIALMNELSLIFNKLDIDTIDVLNAAETKWNFLNFKPGLVGGHCIGVDPYYLTHKAQELGYHPEVILAGRRINDFMPIHVANETIKIMIKNGININNSKILVLGLAFKENCSDVRNSKVIDIVNTLKKYNIKVDVYDPCIDNELAEKEYEIECMKKISIKGIYDAVIIAVAHSQFIKMGYKNIKLLGKKNSVIYDVKSIFSEIEINGKL